jgi:hypothetical protein
MATKLIHDTLVLHFFPSTKQYDGFVKEIMDLVQWEVRYNFALMAQLR